jgi:CheY-like chemotaxis protein
MPGPTGVQLLAMARTAGFVHPFLVVTAFPEDALIESVQQIENADVLGKPFTPSELQRVVKQLMSGVA